ncbi:MAG: histidine phosphatase family protein [Leptolyngbya sp. SIO1D8]|nr:histidine phosphatase family protein [Leptolyngbya sp. SIO1D8]
MSKNLFVKQAVDLIVQVMLKLLFIRHGESTGNREKRMTSHLDDGLTAMGQVQCQHLAQSLYEQGWQPSHIYTSPLRRAIESLDYLLQPWNWPLPTELYRDLTIAQGHSFLTPELYPLSPLASPPITASEQLTEFQAGIFTGLTWAEAKQQYPQLCYMLEKSQDWVAIPHAETPLEGRERASQFIGQLLANHRVGDTVWIISHHWIMEHLIACLMGCDRTWQIAIPNTALFEFWLDRDRWLKTGMPLGISDLWQIKRFCDARHLDENH